jgi:hypothetical protein
MVTVFNWAIALAVLVLGLTGLFYLHQASLKMGGKLRKASTYFTTFAVILLIQGVLIAVKPQLAGLWTSVAVLIAAIFFALAAKKLANAFN